MQCVPVMDYDWSSSIHVLGLLQNTNEINDGSCIGRNLTIRPISVLIMFNHSAVVYLGVGDGKLSHGVGGVLAYTSLFYKHVTMLTDFVSWPIPDTLLLKIKQNVDNLLLGDPLPDS